jgi:predicted DNA-binding ribbon-helix-helix protein
MKSAIVKRSIIIDGHKTSVSLEDAFWSSLKSIARTEGVPVSKMVTEIDRTRERGNLSSARTCSSMKRRIAVCNWKRRLCYFAEPRSRRSMTASISAPPKITMDEIQIQVIKPIAAPSEP